MKQDDIRSKDNWLRRIQEGSWEPEILISGIVLFGLFKVYPLIGELDYFLEMNSSSMFSLGDVNEALTSILKFANVILIVGFLSHILFRSVWAAFVGLSYVYKSGVKGKKLNYPDRYMSDIQKRGDYTMQIIKLEKICSAIFAMSFLLFMWLAGLSVFFSLVAALIGLFNVLFPGNYDYTVLNNTLVIFSLIVFIDFISLGGLRKIPYINKIYYPLHKLAGWLTLSFLYRNIYYGFVSNHKKWKISLALILFSLISFFSVLLIRANESTLVRAMDLAPHNSPYRLDETNYRNKVKDGVFSKRMHIDGFVIDKSYVELFIVHTTEFEDGWILPACNYDSLKEVKGVSHDSLRMSCLENFYGVALDGNLLEDDFIYQRNSTTNQDGLLQIIDISVLENGKHKLDLYYDFYNQEQDTTFHKKVQELFFYKFSKE